MTIEELKRALVEVRELCRNTNCSRCPLGKFDSEVIPYCPLHETEEGIITYTPANWQIDDWKEDSNADKS